MTVKPYRRNRKELSRFSSDLNKFVHDYCIEEMDIMNIDAFTYRACKGAFRILESKHSNEKLTDSERKLHPMLAHWLKFDWKNYRGEQPVIEIFAIYGEAPYRQIIRIQNMRTKKVYKVDCRKIKDRAKLIAWLQFDLSTEEFLGEKYA